MYSVVEISGHQYRVQPGDIIDVQKIEGEEGKDVTFDKVLFIGGDKPAVGTPVVDGASVKARLIRHDKSRKILIFKRKPGTWRKRRGHRQQFTSLLITEINSGADKAAIDKSSERAKKYLK